MNANLNPSALTRRSLVLSILALSACQTSGMGVTPSRTLTSAYDGEWELYVGRFGRDTAFYRSTGNAGREDELARLRLRSAGGRLSVVSVRDYTNAGPNFGDFSGAFYEGDTVSMRFTTSFLFNQRSTILMDFEVPVNETLKNGGWLQIEPDGWDHNNKAIIRLRKVG